MDVFDGIGKAEMERRISDARLSERDEKIARLRLMKRMHFVDMGAEVGCDRRTASRRFNNAVDIISRAL